MVALIAQQIKQQRKKSSWKNDHKQQNKTHQHNINSGSPPLYDHKV